MRDAPAARWRGGLSGRAWTLAIATGGLAPLAAIDPLGISPVFAIAAAALLVLSWSDVAVAGRPLAPAAVLLLLLAAWAAVSASWSILPLHSLLEGLRLGVICAGGIVVIAAARSLAPSEQRAVTAAAAIGLAIASALLLIEGLSGAALTRLVLGHDVPLARFDRGATILVLALWPVLACGAGRPIYQRVVLALAVGAAVLMLASATAALALAAGLVVFAVAWRAPRFAAGALAGGLTLFAVALPLAIPSSENLIAMRQETHLIKWSGIHRLLIWRFTSDRIAERPLLGWGMDASRALPGGKVHLASRFPDAGLPDDAEALPLHPHDAVLQWEVELGIPGTVLCLALVGWGVWRVGFDAALPRLPRASALGWAASALVIALLAYGAWQAWWLASLFLAAGSLSAAAGTPRGSADTPARDRP